MLRDIYVEKIEAGEYVVGETWERLGLCREYVVGEYRRERLLLLYGAEGNGDEKEEFECQLCKFSHGLQSPIGRH